MLPEPGVQLQHDPQVLGSVISKRSVDSALWAHSLITVEGKLAIAIVASRVGFVEIGGTIADQDLNKAIAGVAASRQTDGKGLQRTIREEAIGMRSKNGRVDLTGFRGGRVVGIGVDDRIDLGWSN